MKLSKIYSERRQYNMKNIAVRKMETRILVSIFLFLNYSISVPPPPPEEPPSEEPPEPLSVEHRKKYLHHQAKLHHPY